MLRPTHVAIANHLIDYSDKLLSVSKNPITRSLSVLKLLKNVNHTSSHDLYLRVNQELAKTGKKILIFIDDLDRLNVSEILATIRLIRNTANFHNTFFIVAYDRNYVLQAIKEHNPTNYENFLEKIFQIELSLPYFNPEVLRAKTVRNLCAFISKDYHDEIQKIILDTPFIGPPKLNFWIQNYRDVTRLTNSMNINFLPLQGEVVFKQFLYLQLLRLKFPVVYELLYRARDQYLITNSHDSRNYFLGLQKNEVTAENTSGSQNYLICAHLQDTLQIAGESIVAIKNLLEEIFSIGFDYNRQSIIWPSNFNLYFSYSLWDSNLSGVEFREFRKKELSIFLRKVDDWYHRKLSIELQKTFECITRFDNQKDYEKIIKAIFHLANKEAQHADLKGFMFSFDCHNLMRKIIDFATSIERGHMSVESDAWHKEFISKIFESASVSYCFECRFVSFLLQWYLEGFPLNQKELEKQMIQYLRTYCSSVVKFDATILGLFDSCKVVDWDKSSGNYKAQPERILKEATVILKDFIVNKDFEGFLRAITFKDRDNKGYYMISKKIPNIFDDWSGFHVFLEQHKNGNPQLVEEYLKFFDKNEKSGFNDPVQFDFDKLNLEN